MQQQTAHCASSSRKVRAVSLILSTLLLLLCVVLPPTASAAPSPHCGPFNVSVPHGGSIVIDASACDGPDDFGIGLVEVAPTNGTATVDTLAQTVTYAHFGGGNTATSDTFVFDDGLNNEVTVNVTIGPASTITLSPSTISMTAGVPFSQQFTATGGTAPYTWALDSGTLPPGISLTSGGLLSGTPTQRGNQTFTLRATDAGSVVGTQSYAFTVAGAPLSVSPNAPTGAVVGLAYSVTFTGSGGVSPHTVAYESGTLPPGLSMAGATLSGTPTTIGTYNFSVRVTDASTGPGTYFEVESVSMTVSAPPTIAVAPSTLPGAAVAAAYNQTVSASGGTAPYSFAVTAGALPAGLSLSTTGTLAGTPTAGGTFNFTVTATDANSFTGSRAYSLTVSAPTIAVAPTTLPAGSVASSYSQTIAASGGSAPYSHAVTAGALPAGLSLSAAGALSGTPTASGTFNFTVTATDSSTGTGPYTGSRAYSLSIGAPTVVLPATTLPNATESTAYSAALNAAAGGTAPYSYAVTAGALPTGISLSTSGTLTGTPTASGIFNFTVTAIDSSTGAGPYTASQTYALTVDGLPPLANPVSASVAYGSGAAPISLNIGGGAPTSVAVATAPTHGTAIASGTSITYQPDAGYAGPDSFTYTATNAEGTSAPATVTITVSAPTITITPTHPLTTQVGAAYTQTFTWSGGAAPYSGFAVTGLPAGVAVTTSTANSVTVSGTPTAAGSFTLSTSATDSSTGTGPFTQGQNFTLTVTAPTLVLAPVPGTVSLNYGVANTQAFTTSGGTGPYSYALTAGALPVGMSFSSAGVLSGTPTTPGNYTITVRSTDSSTGTGAPFTVSGVYTLQVGTPAISIGPSTLPDGTVGVAYSSTLTGSGGVAPYNFSLLSGSLPIGMSFSSAGTLSGTPATAGTYNFTIAVQDAHAQSASRAYSLTISAATLVLSPASLPGATAGVAYSQTLTTSGGTAPYAYSLLSGALPAGVSFSSAGTLSGTPTVVGTYNFTVRSTDSFASSVTHAYSLVVAAPSLFMTLATLPNGVVGTAYSATLGTGGGSAPYSYSLLSGALPAGVSFSSAGTFSGTPVTAGSYSFTVRSTDQLGFHIEQAYTLVIADVVPVAANDTAATLAEQPVTIAVTGNDSGAITSIAIATAPAHGTATISGLSIVYTPAAGYSGTDLLTYTAIGPGGSSAAATVTITIAPLPVPQGTPQTATVLAGQAVTIDATTGATGGPFTGVAIATAPTVGTAAVDGMQIVYTAPAAASGAVVFNYTLSNAFGVSAPIAVTVTVNPLPIAVSRWVAAVAGTAVMVDLTAGATGGPFTGAALVSLSPASAGTAAIARNGSIYELTYTPAAGFSGVATATFTLDNAYATSAPAAIDFDVIARPDPTQDADVMGVLGAQASAARRFATAQISNFQQRLENLHDARSDKGFHNGLTFVVDQRCEGPRRAPASGCERPALRDDAAPERTTDAPPANNPFALWTGGAIGSGDREGKAGRSGFDFETSGVSLGADRRIGASFAFGGGIGYGRDDSDIGHNGSRSDADGYTVAAYGSYHPGDTFFLDGLLGHQWLSFDTRRHIAANGGQVSGQRDGTQWFASLSAGADFRRDRLHLSPYARLDVARATLDAYTEKGDAIYALHYQEQDVDTTTASLGLRMDYRYPVAIGTLSPQLRLEYQHDFQDDSSVTMSYADLIGGPFYRAEVEGLERNRFVFGAGAILQTENDLTLRFEYRTLLGSGGDSDHGVQLNIEKSY